MSHHSEAEHHRDQQLIAQVAEHDGDAFDALVARHQSAVYRFVLAIVGSRATAEDVLQQTFLAAYQSAGTFRRASSVRTWLLTIARNAALRARKTEARRAAESSDEGPEDSLVELGVQAGWGDESPESLAIARQRRSLLEAALSRLAPEHREIIVLRDLEEIPGEDVARMLDVTRAAMKSRLHRARLQLAALLRRAETDA